MSIEHNRDLYREGYERGMLEGAAYKDAYFKLLEQIANLQAMTPPAPMMVLTKPAQEVPRLTAETLRDWKDRVNTLASCSTKADRVRVGSALKQDIADAIESALLAKIGGKT